MCVEGYGGGGLWPEIQRLPHCAKPCCTGCAEGGVGGLWCEIGARLDFPPPPSPPSLQVRDRDEVVRRRALALVLQLPLPLMERCASRHAWALVVRSGMQCVAGTMTAAGGKAAEPGSGGGTGGGTSGVGSVKAAKAATTGSTPADDEFAASYITFLKGLMGRLTASAASAAGGAAAGSGGGNAQQVGEGTGAPGGFTSVERAGGGDLVLAGIQHPEQMLLAAGVDRETLSKAFPRLRIRV